MIRALIETHPNPEALKNAFLHFIEDPKIIKDEIVHNLLKDHKQFYINDLNRKINDL